jgi:hypothetical protein
MEEEGEMRTWEPGETVRVVPTEPPPPPQTPAIDEIPEMEREPGPEPTPEPESKSVQLPAGEPESPPERQPELTSEPEPRPSREQSDEIVHAEPEPAPESVAAQPHARAASADDDVSSLFASLRGGGHVEELESIDVPDTEPTPKAVTTPEPTTTRDQSKDWIDVRDSRLLPITNRALRGTKKAIAELQNIALDSLRTDDAWRPDGETIAETLQAEIIGVWAESFAAGHGVAEEMTGTKLKRPATPSSDAAKDFANALAGAVAGALDDAGDGQRERQSAASRVYRVWRTDEAERRIRELAIHAYERGVEESADVGEPVG